MTFLSLEESQDIVKLYPDINWDFSYWKYKSDGKVVIKPSDWSPAGYISIDKVCGAVPSDFSGKIKRVESRMDTPIIKLTPEEKLRKNYDNIAEEAWLFSPEDFEEDMFLDYRICKQIWVLNIKKREITGWAYYHKKLLTYSTRKVAEIVELRPLVEPDFKNSIFYYSLICPAITKLAYPELDIKELSKFHLDKMGEIALRSLVLKAIDGNIIHESMKIKFVSHGNITKELNVFFETEIKNRVEEVRKRLLELVVSFPLEQYLELSDDKYILRQNVISKLLQDIESLSGSYSSEKSDIQTRISGKDWNVPKNLFG